MTAPRAVATARAFLDDAGVCKIGRVAVLPAYRGQHLGERLMLRLEAEMQKLGAKQFKVSAQVRAAGFYEKLGYVRRGEEYLDEYCPHVDMYKPAQAGIGADGMKKRKSLWLILVLLMLAGRGGGAFVSPCGSAVSGQGNGERLVPRAGSDGRTRRGGAEGR